MEEVLQWEGHGGCPWLTVAAVGCCWLLLLLLLLLFLRAIAAGAGEFSITRLKNLFLKIETLEIRFPPSIANRGVMLLVELAT